MSLNASFYFEIHARTPLIHKPRQASRCQPHDVHFARTPRWLCIHRAVALCFPSLLFTTCNALEQLSVESYTWKLLGISYSCWQHVSAAWSGRTSRERSPQVTLPIRSITTASGTIVCKTYYDSTETLSLPTFSYCSWKLSVY